MLKLNNNYKLPTKLLITSLVAIFKIQELARIITDPLASKPHSTVIFKNTDHINGFLITANKKNKPQLLSYRILI